MKHIHFSQIFWGIVLVLLAVLLVIGKLGYFTAPISLWTMILTIFLIAVIIKSIYPLHFGGILFPLAFLGILYDEQLGIEALTPWTLLVAAALLTGGLYTLFGNRLHHHDHKDENWQYDPQKNEWHTSFVNSGAQTGSDNQTQTNGQTTTNSSTANPNGDGGSYIYQNTKFGAATKYVTSADFRKADLICHFGSIELYFDNAQIVGDSAEIHIDASFSGIELYLPHNWAIDNRISATLGGIDDGHAPNGPKDKTVILTGSVSFAGVELHYI